MSPYVNPFTAHCPGCNTPGDWECGTAWDCDTCGNRGIICITEVTFPC